MKSSFVLKADEAWADRQRQAYTGGGAGEPASEPSRAVWAVWGRVGSQGLGWQRQGYPCPQDAARNQSRRQAGSLMRFTRIWTVSNEPWIFFHESS